MKLTQQQTQVIIDNGKIKGLSTQAILTSLVKNGYEPEGVDVNAIKQSLQPKTAEPNYFQRVGADIKQGISQAGSDINTQDNRSSLSKGVSAVSNVAGAVVSPVMEAPGFKQVGELFSKGVNWSGEQLSKLYSPEFKASLANMSPEEFKQATQPLQDLANAGNIANTILLAKGGQKGTQLAKEGVIKTSQGIDNAMVKVSEPLTGKIKTTLSQLQPKDYESAVSSINDAYKTGFVNDQVAVNKQLSKLGSIIGKSPDELVKSLAQEGIVPQVEGKLAKFDNSIKELTDKQNQIASTAQEVLKPINAPTSLGELKTLLENDVKRTADPAELTKSLAEVDRTIESYRLKYGDVLTPEQLGEIRISANNATKSFDRPIFESDVSNSIGNVVRSRLDQIVPDEAYRQANAEWGRLADLKRTINIFDNKPINVGVLGSQLGRFGGAIALGGVAFPFSGPGSLVIAGIAATYGGDFVANFLRNKKFNIKAQTIIKESLKSNPNVLQTLIEKSSEANSKYLQKLLPAPKAGTPNVSNEVPINLPKESASAVEQRQIKQIQSQLEKGKTSPKSTTPKLKVKGEIPTTKSPLLKEAQKYKSAEEFVKKTTWDWTDQRAMGGGEPYAGVDINGKVAGAIIPSEDMPIPKTAKGAERILEQGKFGVLDGNANPIGVFNTMKQAEKALKSQLTDIWNQSKGIAPKGVKINN